MQGVFFRVTARDQATRIGLTGWVRNTKNNEVELVACGNESQLLQLEAWLKTGPPLAAVHAVEGEKIDELIFSSFSLRA